MQPTISTSRRDFLRRALLATGTTTVAARAAAADTPSDPTRMSAVQLAAAIRARRLSALEAVDACIARQLAINDRLNAVVTQCYERARSEARALDASAARATWKGPLHGVPMTIKDSLDTEGVVTTGGTVGRMNYVPQKDATVVARLRAAGAILLGKTNTPEFTLGGLTGVSTTSNILFGTSHNPYDLTRSTSGSSGGAGAIVAACGAPFDIGSDWGGSIRGPAHNNGIAGIKPTSVRVPRTGHIVDFGGVFDMWQQLGPLARTVADLELITPLISGPDFRDCSCAPVPWADPAKVDLKKLKVAFFPSNGVAEPDEATKKTVAQAAAWLGEVTASVVEDCPKEILADLYEARSALVGADDWMFFKRLADRWGTNNFAPSVKERMAGGEPLSSAALVEAWERHDLAKSRMLRWITSKGYDVVLCPVATSAATSIDRPPPPSTAGRSWSYNGAFNTTGWPVVVVRCGTDANGVLPIGVQVVGKPWREDVCLAAAAHLESRSGGWKMPPI